LFGSAGVAFGHARTCLHDAVVPVLTLPGRQHLWSADNGLRRTTDVIVGQFQSFLCWWSTSVESAAYINLSNRLYHYCETSSKI